MWFKSSFTITAVVAISLCFIGGKTPAYADLGDQLFKLLPDDGAENDIFSVSVAISGTTAIVGAFLDDDNGDSSGSAYLFDTTTGQQITKLLPNDGRPSDHFGISVAITGSPGKELAIIGARFDDDNGYNSGSVYIFDITTGRQIAKLFPNDGAEGDFFGRSVAVSGSTVIVGACHDDDNGLDSGSAYLFDTTTGTQIAKLLPDDGAPGEGFGQSVAISGATAIVGAYLDDDNGANSGSAYLFDTTTGQQIAKLLPDDGAPGDGFGLSVAISESTAIVGAYLDDDNGANSGSVYLFDTTTGRQIAKLLPDDGAEQDWFGLSVAISESTAIVGAIFDNDNGNFSGSAYLFDISNPAHPKQLFKLLAKDGEATDNFGFSVAISGATGPGQEIAIVGAIFDDDNGLSSGSAYVFDLAGTSPCPWDLDNSGSVGTGDLLELFAQWGTAGSADFDESGAVDTADLLILFANWGPCP